MLQNEYLIQDLAEKTGTSPRTIRYYQQEGLLPEPENRGKYAFYNDDHLKRLKLIQELKKSFLPLNEIKKRLSSLTSQQVLELLENQVSSEFHEANMGQPAIKKPVQSVSENAQDYIAHVLSTQPGVNQQEPISPQPQKSSDSRRYLIGSPTENWQRILVTPWLEIHVRGPLSPKDQKALEELIKFARNLF